MYAVRFFPPLFGVDRPKTRCVKLMPMCASARVALSNIVYLKYGYRSTGKGVLTTKVLLFRQYLKNNFKREFNYAKTT